MTTSAYYQPASYEPSELTSTRPDEAPLPVVVIGAGPVGMAVALGLHAAARPSRSSRLPLRMVRQPGHLHFTAQPRGRRPPGNQRGAVQRVLPWEGGRSFYRDQEVLHFRMPDEASSASPR